jgi:hypothetical protein
MRSLLFLVAGLAVATPLLTQEVLAQEAAQQELNALTRVPLDMRCFQSIPLAQEMAKHYVASGLCPQQINPVHPAEFMQALEEQKAVDKDFTSDACQLQLSLMFRAGREWINKDPRRHCPSVAQEMRQRPFFKAYVHGK